MDTDLFELCKEVYRRTEWQHGYLGWWVHDRYHHDIQVDRTWISDRLTDADELICPLYTSDYLLEKLPPVIFTRTSDGSNLTAILTLWVNGDKTVHVAYMIPFDEQNRGDYAKTADTPIKALLKLAIALDDAGELK
jgi:hypothetical protein